MGGKALSKTTRRVELEEYVQLKTRLSDLLSKFFKHVAVPFENPDKTSFGDVDFLVVPHLDESGHAVPVTFNPLEYPDLFPTTTECKTAGDYCTSFDYEGVQIDLITIGRCVPVAMDPQQSAKIQDELLDMAMAFFSWGDFGSILGCIVSAVEIRAKSANADADADTQHVPLDNTDNMLAINTTNTPSPERMRLLYGHNGLLLAVPLPKNQLGRILVSTCPRVIFDFLGLDFEVWKRGFRTQEEIFTFLMSSRFFQPCMFHVDRKQGRHKAKARRPMFESFVAKVVASFSSSSSEPKAGRTSAESTTLPAVLAGCSLQPDTGAPGTEPNLLRMETLPEASQSRNSQPETETPPPGSESRPLLQPETSRAASEPCPVHPETPPQGHVSKPRCWATLDEVLDHFPGARETYDSFLDQARAEQAFRLKWNSALVKEVTGMTDGLQLSAFMRDVLTALGGKQGVLAASDQEIRQTITHMFRTHI